MDAGVEGGWVLAPREDGRRRRERMDAGVERGWTLALREVTIPHLVAWRQMQRQEDTSSYKDAGRPNKSESDAGRQYLLI